MSTDYNLVVAGTQVEDSLAQGILLEDKHPLDNLHEFNNKNPSMLLDYIIYIYIYSEPQKLVLVLSSKEPHMRF